MSKRKTSPPAERDASKKRRNEVTASNTGSSGNSGPGTPARIPRSTTNIRVDDDKEKWDWIAVDEYVKYNPSHMAQHHIDSYDYFRKTQIYEMIHKNNPITIERKSADAEKDLKCNMYIGCKPIANQPPRIYFGQPVIHDGVAGELSSFMFPNLARLRNMTYSVPIHYDLEIEMFDENDDPILIKNDQNESVPSFIYEKVFLCNLPIMVKSKSCVLAKMGDPMLRAVGEDPVDPGGYFIIDGADKVMISQEEDAANTIIVFWAKDEEEREAQEDEDDDEDDIAGPNYIIQAKIKSRSDDPSKPPNTVTVQLSNDPTIGITVRIPHTSENIPLFIMFRAMGIVSDKEILETIFLKPVEQVHERELEFFESSIEHARCIFTQRMALDYIADITHNVKTKVRVMQIMSQYVLPHIESSDDHYLQMQEKALFLGLMTAKMARVYHKIDVATDREHGRYRRVAVSGVLLGRVFNENLQDMKMAVKRRIETTLFAILDKGDDSNRANASLLHLISDPEAISQNFATLILNMFPLIFENNPEVGQRIDNEIKKVFKGAFKEDPVITANAGKLKSKKTRLIGVIHHLSRQTNLGFLSDLRQVEQQFPKDKEKEMLKLPGPHLLHNSQHGLYDPVNTAEDAYTGLKNSLAFFAHVTRGYPRKDMEEWIEKTFTRDKYLPLMVAKQNGQLHNTKIMVNGHWLGVSLDPIEHTAEFKAHRRHGRISIFTSIYFDVHENTINIWTDAGRLTRPLWYREKPGQAFSYRRAIDNMNWPTMLTGSIAALPTFNYRNEKILVDDGTFSGISGRDNPNLLEMIDAAEAEYSLVMYSEKGQQVLNDAEIRYASHMELHPSVNFGILANNVLFMENNPCVRTLIACKHNKQGVSMYHSQRASRMDQSVMVLEFGQVPLVKSRYLKFANEEKRPHGENCMVAILSTVGYNVEDALCFNAGSIERGMFMTTRYVTYQFTETVTRISDYDEIHSLVPRASLSDDRAGVLDENGILKRGTVVSSNTPLMWTERTMRSASDMPSRAMINAMDDKRKAHPVRTNRFEMGVVDEVYVSPGMRGSRVIKIRVREMRMPSEGDKFASRGGQKGILGRIIPEEDIPFMASGLRPDIIMNPHAFPSRQTLGQFNELVGAVQSVLTGYVTDATSYCKTDHLMGDYARQVAEMCNFSSLCSQALYCSETGRVFPSLVCMGINYYLRLQQMVSDKVNYRLGGPLDKLTRQPVDGRAHGGGLRVGEMETFALLAHGASATVHDAMMTRADKFEVGVCNQTGTVAVYNPAEHVYHSLGADGTPEFANAPTEEAPESRLKMNARVGRNFSRVEIPWCLRLLQIELQTAGIEMRLITDDGIDTDIQDQEWMRERREERLLESEKELANNGTPRHVQMCSAPSLIDNTRLLKTLSEIVIGTTGTAHVLDEDEDTHVVYDGRASVKPRLLRFRKAPVFVPRSARPAIVPFVLPFNKPGDARNQEDDEDRMSVDNEHDGGSREQQDGGMLERTKEIIDTDGEDEDEDEDGTAALPAKKRTQSKKDKGEPVKQKQSKKREAAKKDEEKPTPTAKKRKPNAEEVKTTQAVPATEPVSDKRNATDFEMYDTVLYSNDFLPTRIWRVMDVGPKLLTIETKNPLDLECHQMTQIVPREYIRRPCDVPADAPVSTRPSAVAAIAAQAALLSEQMTALVGEAEVPQVPFQGTAPAAPVSIRIVNQPNTAPCMSASTPATFQPSSSLFR